MKWITLGVCALLTLGSATTARAQDTPLPAPCAPVSFEGDGFVACTVDPAKYDIRLFLKGADGKPYGSLATFAADGPPVVFAMNAGMYLEDFRPQGLFIEGGQTVRQLNTRDAEKYNFYLKPNGVFTIGTDGRAAVVATDLYAPSPDIAYATQSGPMLVIDNALHPAFDPNGSSLKTRNGVGVRADGTVVFAISRGPVSFGRFARLFRDQLACPNALFLDGVVSALADDNGIVVGGGYRAGPIVGVVAK